MGALERTFGARLRRVRLEKGLTQRQVAEPGYTHAYISTIEAGRRYPSPEALSHFANRLGVEVEALVSGRPPGLTDDLDRALADARRAASDGRAEEARAAATSALQRAHRYGVHGVEARAHEILGLLFERAGTIEAAFAEYERADAVLEDEPEERLVEAITGKARCLQALGDVRYAILILESLRRRLPRDSATVARAGLGTGLLSAYLDAGLVRSAEETAAELAQLLPSVRDDARRGQIALYLARLHAAKGQASEADRLLSLSAKAYEASGLRSETGYAHLARGYLDSRRGKLRAAARELNLARRIFEETQNDRELSNTLIELARVARSSGDFKATEALLEDVLGRLPQDDTEFRAWAHREYALLFEGHDDARSEKHFRTALDLFDRGDEHVETAATYRMLGDHLRARGDIEAALEAYSLGIRRVPSPA